MAQRAGIDVGPRVFKTPQGKFIAQPGDILGKGTYGVVYKVRHEKDPSNVKAIKTFTPETMDESEGVPSTTLREINALKVLNHPNVLKAEGVVMPDDPSALTEMFVITELCQGTLKDKTSDMIQRYLHSDRRWLKPASGSQLPTEYVRAAKVLAWQLLNALATVHSCGITHRDLKPANIMWGFDDLLKLGDFGLARFVRGNQNSGELMMPQTGEVQTMWYRAPEVLLGDERYGLTVDDWSLGCIIAEFFRFRINSKSKMECDPIFSGRNDAETLLLVFETLGTPQPATDPAVSYLQSLTYWSNEFPRWFDGNLRKRIPLLDDLGAEFLKELLMINPCRRRAARFLLDHPWFDDVRKELGRFVPWYQRSQEGYKQLMVVDQIPPARSLKDLPPAASAAQTHHAKKKHDENQPPPGGQTQSSGPLPPARWEQGISAGAVATGKNPTQGASKVNSNVTPPSNNAAAGPPSAGPTYGGTMAAGGGGSGAELRSSSISSSRLQSRHVPPQQKSAAIGQIPGSSEVKGTDAGGMARPLQLQDANCPSRQKPPPTSSTGVSPRTGCDMGVHGQRPDPSNAKDQVKAASGSQKTQMPPSALSTGNTHINNSSNSETATSAPTQRGHEHGRAGHFRPATASLLTAAGAPADIAAVGSRAGTAEIPTTQATTWSRVDAAPGGSQHISNQHQSRPKRSLAAKGPLTAEGLPQVNRPFVGATASLAGSTSSTSTADPAEAAAAKPKRSVAPRRRPETRAAVAAAAATDGIRPTNLLALVANQSSTWATRSRSPGAARARRGASNATLATRQQQLRIAASHQRQRRLEQGLGAESADSSQQSQDSVSSSQGHLSFPQQGRPFNVKPLRRSSRRLTSRTRNICPQSTIDCNQPSNAHNGESLTQPCPPSQSKVTLQPRGHSMAR